MKGSEEDKMPSPDERRLYGDLVWVWQISSPPEEYAEETELYCRLIRERAKIPAKSVLALGCGAGNIEHTMKKYFDVTGVDVSEQMLEAARRLNPNVTYLAGDMRSVRLGRSFDAVIILDSIGYMLTEDDLRAAFETAYVHLAPGGVFLTLAEDTLERFKQNRTLSETKRRGDTEITWIENHYDPDPSDTTFEATFVYLVRRAGRLEIQSDRHLIGLFPLQTWLDLLRGTGFEVEQLSFEPPVPDEAAPYPLFVCSKPL